MFALIEFTGALPRAHLYNSWEVADDTNLMKTLVSESFDPQTSLLVSPPAPVSPGTNTVAATNKVEVVSYQPRAWEIQTESSASGILLLNDKFNENWHVSVDNKPETLLRCNYIMRGVYLQAGAHRVSLSYKIPPRGLYISFASIFSAIALSCLVGFRSVRRIGQSKNENLASA